MKRRERPEAAMARDRWIVGAAMALVCLLAWIWLVRQSLILHAPSAGPFDWAAMGKMAMEGAASPRGPADHDLLAIWLPAFVMWSVMMVAMMLPSAGPMIFAYADYARRHNKDSRVLVWTFVFSLVYVLIWIGFSALVAMAHVWLIQAGLVSELTMSLGNDRLAGGLLVSVGLYQLSPIKRACLEQCRSPGLFVSRLWRPGWLGAARMGLAHGAVCMGCCWLLMELLFIGGVMNLAWIAIIGVIATFEKIAPVGRRGAAVIGVLAITAGLFRILR